MNIEQMLQLEKQQKENISEYLDAWFNKLSQRECLDDNEPYRVCRRQFI